MGKYILTVTLNPAMDKTVIVPDFRIGRDFRAKALSISAGGKGINVSQVLGHLGIKNVACGFLGGHDGRHMKQMLDKERISNDFCFVDESTRTSLTVIDPKNTTITRVLERGPRVTGKNIKTFRKKYTSLLTRCQYVVLSGRNIPGAGDSFYAELINLAKRKKVFTVLDTSGDPYRIGLKEKPFMIKPNLGEAEQILCRKISSIRETMQAVKEIGSRDIPITAITLGSRGVIAFNGAQMVFAVPPKVKRKSPVGCGDAYIGGFIAAHSLKKSFTECIKTGVACGAANALSLNPGDIKKNIVNKLYKQVTIKLNTQRK